MNLKQKTISEIMLEAGKKIAAVDQYNGLIAECESLAGEYIFAHIGAFRGHDVCYLRFG